MVYLQHPFSVETAGMIPVPFDSILSKPLWRSVFIRCRMITGRLLCGGTGETPWPRKKPVMCAHPAATKPRAGWAAARTAANGTPLRNARPRPSASAKRPKRLQNTKTPTLIFHGEDDRYGPCEMSRKLLQSCASPCTLFTVPGAGHGLSYMIDPEEYENRVYYFLNSIPRLAGKIKGTPVSKDS